VQLPPCEQGNATVSLCVLSVSGAGLSV